MWRIIFLAILVWVVIALVKKVLKHDDAGARLDQSSDQNESTLKDIVKCEQCEVHVLKSEAFSINGQFYCSKAHLPDNPNQS